jgi:hypothetical protein
VPSRVFVLATGPFAGLERTSARRREPASDAFDPAVSRRTFSIAARRSSLALVVSTKHAMVPTARGAALEAPLRRIFEDLDRARSLSSLAQR